MRQRECEKLSCDYLGSRLLPVGCKRARLAQTLRAQPTPAAIARWLHQLSALGLDKLSAGLRTASRSAYLAFWTTISVSLTVCPVENEESSSSS